MKNRFSKLDSTPIPLGEGRDPGPEHPTKFTEIKFTEPLPICSVCKTQRVCFLEEMSTGKVLEIFDKCKGCLLEFPV